MTVRSISSAYSAPAAETTRLSLREKMPRELAVLLPAAVYTARTGAVGAWLYASPQIEAIFGYPPQQFLDDPGLWARMLHPEDRDWVLQEEETALSATDDRTYAEYRMIAKDGRVIWVLDDVTLQPDPVHGSVQHGLLFDITQRKIAEMVLVAQADVLGRVARGSSLGATLQALAASLVRVTGAESCAVALHEGPTYVSGAARHSEPHQVERIPFGAPAGALPGLPLGELLVLGVGDAPELRLPDGTLSLEWAQRLAGLAVDRARQVAREAHSYSLLAATLESTVDGILVVDDTGRVISSNQKFRTMWNMPQDLIQDGNDAALIDFVTHQLRDPERFVAEIQRLYAAPAMCSLDELVFIDGRVFERASQPQLLEGRPVGRVWSFRDVTDFRRLEGELRRQAHTDALTGLPNRHRFMERLSELVPATSLTRAAQARSGQEPRDAVNGPVVNGYALLLIDVDDFKTVNDGLGHLAGDALLVALADRVSRCVREDDMTARLGGDEFAVVVGVSAGTVDAQSLAERIGAALAAPLDIDGRSLSIRASVGIALSDGVTPARDLVRNADLAMYTAKREGGACYRLYTSSMHDVAISRLDLRADLDQAITEGSIEVVYQPVVSLRTGAIDGFEALARWQHPKLGAISPAEFIPLAEETGLIGRLGQWVLSRVCSDVARWRDGFADQVPTVSVNLSPRQLSDPALVEQVATVIHANRLPPASICLEVTETGLGQTGPDAVAILEQIHAQGVLLALDDFGTGHSSLARLGSYPIDVVKIDRDFVVGLTEGSRDRAVVQAVLSLADAFSLDVIAEGVETTAQREVLAELGCPRVQGFLFSRPIPEAQVVALLQGSARIAV